MKRSMEVSRDRRAGGVWALLCTVISLFPPAGALGALDPRAVAEMSLEELLAVPVTVASRAAETFVHAPSSVTVFTRRELRDMGVRYVEELLNFVPGMQSVRTASRSHFVVGIRGSNAKSLSADVLFLLDGQRLNDDFSGAALLFHRFLTTGDLAQVEVVRGPGSALYGSNAFLAVVNLVTSRELNEASVTAGSHAYRDGRLALSGGDERYHASLYLEGFRDHGATFPDRSDPAGGEIRDPRSALSAYATLESGRLSLSGRHNRFSADDFYLLGITPSSEVNDYNASDSALNGDLRLLEGERGRLRLSGGVRRIDSDGLSEPLGAAFMQELHDYGLTQGTEAFLGGPAVRTTEWHLSLDGDYRTGGGHRLSAGVTYRHTRFDKIVNRNNYETLELVEVLLGRPRPVTYYGEVVETGSPGPQGDSRGIIGAYLQDQYQLTEALGLTLGVRVDRYSDFGSSTNPRAALVYAMNDATTLKLMYGEAFRAPTVLELGTKNSPRTLGNPDLEAEKVRTWELAWHQEFAWLHTTLTGYRSRISDRIQNVRIGGGDPRLIFANSGGVVLSGLEFEAQANPTPNLWMRATFSHAIEMVEEPRGTARNLASLILNYRWRRLNANLNGIHQSSVETGGPIRSTLDGYWLFNANLRYRLGGAVLVGGIYNLFDTDYATFTTTGVPGGTPNRGREVHLGVEIGI